MSELARFFNLQRSIIGTCPWCREFFRLSDCRFIAGRYRPDWLDSMMASERRLELAQDRVSEQEKKIRTLAREKGRSQARRAVRKVDGVFAPLGLCVDDAASLFHPVDFIVFDQISVSDKVRDIYLIDRKAKPARERALQRSIERCVEREKYEWRTFRVEVNGKVIEE